MKRKFKTIAILLCILLIVGGIVYLIVQKKKQKQPENTEINYQKVTMITNLRLGISQFDNIHPFLTQNRDVIQIDKLIFEPLLTISEDYRIAPCLAKEWSKVGEKNYVFKLNETAKWHDGTPLTAEDVKFTIETLQKSNSIYVENIKEISTVEVVDSHTVKMTLTNEIPFFEYYLIFPIISKAQYENITLEDDKQIPLGTGQYKISKLEEDKIELTKNENWRNMNTQNANIKTISITKYENMGEIYNAFKIGNVDFFQTSNQKLEDYIGSMGYQKKEYRGREYDYLALNCQNKTLQYQEVRQALSYAINQEEIISTVFQNSAYAAYFPLDYSSYVIDTKQLQKGNDTKIAEKILKDAEWSYEHGIWQKRINGTNHQLKFTLAVKSSDEIRVKVAEEIKKQLEKIGIQITIQKVSENTYQAYLKNHQYELLLTGIYNSYSPDLTTFFGERNLANFENEEISLLLHEVQNITEESLLKEKYQKILDIYQNEIPYIGLYRNKNTVIYNYSLMGDVKPNNYSLFYQFSGWYRQ
ncbi:MAG: peptide ABC transporter substrate-binding protein [Clostridia bacterium]|nr:peptide ABC transporter substrate-binding protein [Clostridia bacterium]